MAKIVEETDLRNKNYVFKNRAHAGELLARKLKTYSQSPIVLAIPSGGVPVGAMIAKQLDLPMDMVIVRKIPIPFNTEAGFGSVSWDGEVLINRMLLRQLGLTKAEIESAISEAKRELNKRIVKFRGKRTFPELKDRTVIIVDDGLASGYTMLSAISSIRKYSPARIIVAVPTASKNAIETVSPHVDELICLNIRETTMFAVADAYKEWHDLDEHEVLAIIKDGF
ncbi:MAG: phosphoribosyltransferase family protein [Candidatus Methanoperedens sp.]|nr:phosphoribosyltransferase family protein [Candidatus Methanoperedens sp.]MCZ7370437.1 phosphoribosyltransferase family protein [Candidatus Methanoperedens sp.]